MSVDTPDGPALPWGGKKQDWERPSEQCRALGPQVVPDGATVQPAGLSGSDRGRGRQGLMIPGWTEWVREKHELLLPRTVVEKVAVPATHAGSLPTSSVASSSVPCGHEGSGRAQPGVILLFSLEARYFSG